MRFKKNNSKSIRRLLNAAAIALFSGVAAALPAASAEKMYFDYGYLNRAISTASLEAFVEEGTVNSELAPYLNRMSVFSHQELQQFLNTPLSASTTGVLGQFSNPFVLSQWLQAPTGDLVLDTLGALVQTQGRQNGRQAMRGALVAAAADPGGLSVMNVIRFYPTEAVRLNLPNILALAQSISANRKATERLVGMAIEQSKVAAGLDPSIDYSALPVLSDMAQFEVIKQTLTLQDRSRASRASPGSASRQQHRTYAADLYLPSSLHAPSKSLSPQSIPVMVISHGYGDSRHLTDTVTLARQLAASGFAVAVLEHVGSNRDYRANLSQGLTQESFEAMTFINRPLDIKFLLDTLEQKNSTEFQGRLQLERVGVIGHSLGGYSALAAAGATIDIERLQSQCDPTTELTPTKVNMALLIQCRALELSASPETSQQLADGRLKDERVALVIALAPLTNLFGSQGMSQIDVPVVIMGGARDVMSPIVLEQMHAFRWLQTPHKYFYLAENTAHTPEMSRFILNLSQPETDIINRFDQSERDLFKLTVSLAIAHGKVHLLDDASYQPYLTSAYVNAVSPELTRLHLLRTMPPEF
ncbi:alpha/beta hydrolase [cf. Phormidesmis sp. LEGE 11477]|uniref:alpha/beta hydrolase n=1 Tax=cf. Phormidesmis sp. LEGE 11477 TaxID=1828680 RepID=UPI00187E6D7D|nr:alpha/beta hydrolase [cf. Phormidesmis sp. LEGE 11477]MBE9063167.1 alpha/beta hydrolase [cf. Phormidesmis sp. LEGE 11477]